MTYVIVINASTNCFSAIAGLQHLLAFQSCIEDSLVTYTFALELKVVSP